MPPTVQFLATVIAIFVGCFAISIIAATAFGFFMVPGNGVVLWMSATALYRTFNRGETP